MNPNEVQINKGYELYQIITDFGEPLEIFREAFQNAIDENAQKVFCHVYEKQRMSGSELIIDIWNDGNALKKEQVANFFGLAKSTKVDENNMPIKGKLGYKGHGAKIFFNARKVQICSKEDGIEWGVDLDAPLTQLEDNNTFEYSNVIPFEQLEAHLPDSWRQGFMVRIIGPRHFGTLHTQFKLNHMYLRDYIKWYTVFGTIQTLYDDNLKERGIKLYLSGLKVDDFKKCYNRKELIDPLPTFENIDSITYEILEMGHIFPEERCTETKMKQYAASVNSTKAYYDFYSRMIYNSNVVCSNNTAFRLIISLEGYETKRRYDLLLSKRGKSRTEMVHTDGERYGLWVCKGGVPVEKVDDWIEGGKGTGTYTYMQAFIDCEDFQLTANRGSIKNSDIEKIEIVKKELNRILNDNKIKALMNERADMEALEKQIQSIDGDLKDLAERKKSANNRNKITLPNGVVLQEPTKNKSGYSESETMVLLINVMAQYPSLFTFKLLDYNTTKGIDFVVEVNGEAKYIELKGTLGKKMNHPFRCIDKFICYQTELEVDDVVTDIEDFETKLFINKQDKFSSYDEQYKNKVYKSYRLRPNSAQIKDMEIICLKEILTDIIGAKIG